MPTCIKCSAHFPNRAHIDGKVHVLNHRKLCLDCSPFGQHNTRILKLAPNTEVECTNCGRSYNYDHTKGHGTLQCNSCFTTSQRRLRKQQLVDELGGACVLCGYNKSVVALHFHHRDPTLKEFHVTGGNRSYKSMLAEAKKCVLLCSNCHAEVHAGVTQLDRVPALHAGS